MMVTHQKEVYYRLQIWQLHFTLKTPGGNCHEWSPTFPGMLTNQPNLVGDQLSMVTYHTKLVTHHHKYVTHQKKVYYRLGVCHLDLTHKTDTR